MKEWFILEKVLRDVYKKVQKKFTIKELMFLYRIIMYENQPETEAKREIMHLGGYSKEEIWKTCKNLKDKKAYHTEMGLIKFDFPNPFRDNFKEKLKKELESEVFVNALN